MLGVWFITWEDERFFGNCWCCNIVVFVLEVLILFVFRNYSVCWFDLMFVLLWLESRFSRVLVNLTMFSVILWNAISMWPDCTFESCWKTSMDSLNSMWRSVVSEVLLLMMLDDAWWFIGGKWLLFVDGFAKFFNTVFSPRWFLIGHATMMRKLCGLLMTCWQHMIKRKTLHTPISRTTLDHVSVMTLNKYTLTYWSHPKWKEVCTSIDLSTLRRKKHSNW